MRLAFCWVALVVASGLAGCERGHHGALRVFYHPIGTATLTPVTMSNIEQRSQVCTISEPSDVADVRRLIRSGQPLPADPDRRLDLAVRAKIVESNTTAQEWVATVGNHGQVRTPAGDTTLSEAELSRLKALLEGACNAQNAPGLQ